MEAVAAGSDICLIVSSDLVITQVICGPQLAALAGKIDHWRGAPLMSVFAWDSVQKLTARLADTEKVAKGSLSLELNHDQKVGRNNQTYVAASGHGFHQ